MQTATNDVRCSACNLRDICLTSGLEKRQMDVFSDPGYTRKRVKRGDTLYRSGAEFEAIYAVRTGFLKSSVDRFVTRHGDEVERGSKFSQMTDNERDEIIDWAKSLAQAPSATLAMVGKVFLDNGFSPKSAATVVFASITELCPSNYSYTTAGAEDLAGDGGELYA